MLRESELLSLLIFFFSNFWWPARLFLPLNMAEAQKERREN
jgi:hypothetical protein